MSQKKRQHYVPKFLLKKFSIDGNDKQINIYNIENAKFITNASLKEQCALDYFYGKDDDLEEGFAEMETEASKIINSIILKNIVPERKSVDFLTLISFSLILSARTPNCEEEISDFFSAIDKKMMMMDPRLKQYGDKIECKINEPLKRSLYAMISELPVALDLEVKLLVNNTAKSFWLSDNPVVYYNSFFEKKTKWFTGTGLADKGLQIFLPISPKHMLHFYDSDVYKVGCARKKTIELFNDYDIYSLNKIQFINSKNCIYSNQGFIEPEINQLNDINKKIKNNQEPICQECKTQFQKQDNEVVLLTRLRKNINCKFSLKIIKLLDKAKKYDLGNKLIHYRNESLVKANQEFLRLVDNGQYNLYDIIKFAKDKTGKA